MPSHDAIITATLKQISEELANVRWGKDADHGTVVGFPRPIPSNWPLQEKLSKMMAAKDRFERPIGDHVKRVIANVNGMVEPQSQLHKFFKHSDDNQLNNRVTWSLANAHNRCWLTQDGEKGLFLGAGEVSADMLLRICALYHDIGKMISTERHVSRGVHLMRDVSDRDRQEIEGLFVDFLNRRDFWAIIRHHDIYGCLCTGEASFPAISAMVSWSYPDDFASDIYRRIAAHLSYLLWLNIADVSAQFHGTFGCITAFEAERYLSDWNEILRALRSPAADNISMVRERFNHRLFEIASHVNRTFDRIARIVTTCYHVVYKEVPPPNIQLLVEEELQNLHGPRLERFCYRFARFTKLDYGLRFFNLLMQNTLIDHHLLKVKRIPPIGEKPEQITYTVINGTPEQELEALRSMVHDTCLILGRIVEEYGQLVESEDHAYHRLGVNMSGLMESPETGRAICQALKNHHSRALWWIADEVSVWLYPE